MSGWTYSQQRARAFTGITLFFELWERKGFWWGLVGGRLRMGQSFRWRTGAGWRRSPCGCRPRLRPRGSARSSARPSRRHWFACRECVQGVFRACITSKASDAEAETAPKRILHSQVTLCHTNNQACSHSSFVVHCHLSVQVLLTIRRHQMCSVRVVRRDLSACKLRSRCQTSGKTCKKKTFRESQLYLKYIVTQTCRCAACACCRCSRQGAP